jgi:GNAT superfamily N-acetyltransferase
MEALPERCRGCLFWELGTPRPIDRAANGESDALVGDPAEQKTSWWRTVEAGEGSTGEPARLARAVRFGEEIAGYALLGAPTAFAPRRAPVPRVSRDALFLATIWISPAFRGQGAARLLLLAAVKEAAQQGRDAVEAYGDRRYRERACVLPCTWLLHEGFVVEREHPRYPLLRLDSRRIARWTEPIEQALGQALGRLGPEPSPVPQRASCRSDP